jgi:hypothetical protein
MAGMTERLAQTDSGVLRQINNRSSRSRMDKTKLTNTPDENKITSRHRKQWIRVVDFMQTVITSVA